MIEYGDHRLPPRFWKKVQVSDGCWLWTAAKSRGYGYFGWDGKPQNAHRVAYAVLVGSIPAGYDVDHLCHNADLSCPGGDTCPHRRCVRLDHLEAVPSATNKLRGRSFAADKARQTMCAKGLHELSGANLRHNKRGQRWCYACKLVKNAEWRANNREKWLESCRKYTAKRKAS